MAFLYPLLVFFALVVFKFSVRYLSALIIVFAVGYFLLIRKNYHGKHSAVIFISPALLFTIGIVCLLTKSPIILKMYPALADLIYVIVIGTSFLIPPPLVYYVVEMFDKTVKTRPDKERIMRFCREASLVWCGFFVFDGIVAVVTVFWASDFVWSLYNGGISYGGMGAIFLVQFVMLKKITKKRCVAEDHQEIQEGS
jgi:uncharacterized membrane protein